MLLPVLILFFAAIPAAIVAYGIDPAWAQYPHGIELILLSRRLQWPLIALAILLCVGLLGWIISGKGRVWWLIGLAPILALMGHRFAMNPENAFLVNGDPSFVSADQASFVSADDWVVGLMDGPDAVAYPYASLYSRPLVVRSNQVEPMMLMWSPFANCVTAFRVDRSIRAGELEVVSMPANALLVYNSRIGQFINGVTGQTMDGRKPAGFISAIPTIKTTWGNWLALHPGTTVLSPPLGSGVGPRRAVLPYFPMPKHSDDLPFGTMIALIRGVRPAAAMEGDIGVRPANYSDPLVVLYRDRATGSVEGFDRHGDEDLVPAFAGRVFSKFPQATMIDSDSGSAWTADGRAVDGAMKGKKLEPVDVEDLVYYSVARFWFGDLPIVTPISPPVIRDGRSSATVRPARHRHGE